MRDTKKEVGLGGDANWPKLYFVSVEGDPNARGKPIEQWNTVAVFEVHPASTFHIAFKSKLMSQRLRTPLSTGQFGMRIGPDNVEFFVIPVNPREEVVLRLVKITTIDDSSYPDLPVY